MIIYITSSEINNSTNLSDVQFKFNKLSDSYIFVTKNSKQHILSVMNKSPYTIIKNTLNIEEFEVACNYFLTKVNINLDYDKDYSLSMKGEMRTQHTFDYLVTTYNFAPKTILFYDREDLKETAQIFKKLHGSSRLKIIKVSSLVEADIKDDTWIVLPPLPELGIGQIRIDGTVTTIPFNENNCLIPSKRKSQQSLLKNDFVLTQIESEYFIQQYSFFREHRYDEHRYEHHRAYEHHEHQLYIFYNQPYIRIFSDESSSIKGIFFPFSSIYDNIVEMMVNTKTPSMEKKILDNLFKQWDLEFMRPYFHSILSFLVSVSLGWRDSWGNYAFYQFVHHYNLDDEQDIEFNTVEDLSQFNIIPEENFGFQLEKHSQLYQTSQMVLATSSCASEPILKNFPQLKISI